MLEFFPNGDPSQEPQVSQSAAKRFILNETGLCLISLGRLAEAVSFFERYVTGNISAEDWHNASVGYWNLAELHASLGHLAASAEAAREALALAHRAENKLDEGSSLSRQAWAAHLLGDVETATDAFRQAEALEREINPTVQYLYSLRGIFHAEHLRRTGDLTYARQITEANLEEWVSYSKWPKDESHCHRVLGDLDADALRQGSGQANQHDSARDHYNEALRIARGISVQDILIEALLARGRWAARQGEARPARNDLDEALAYAVEGGYRIYEADIRVALAWAHRAAGQLDSARAEASRALQMSQEMGYYWGQVDAEEVLEVI
jgi:tetratricopeptide (TPR) repeat protein